MAIEKSPAPSDSTASAPASGTPPEGAPVPVPGTSPQSSSTNWIGQIGNALGLLSASAALLFVSGGTVLIGRLYVYKLAALEVVIGQLPQAILVTTGLVEVVAPCVAVAAAYVMFRLIEGARGKRLLLTGWSNQRRFKQAWYVALFILSGFAAWAVPTAYWIVFGDGGCLQGCAGPGLATFMAGKPDIVSRLQPLAFWLTSLGASLVFVGVGYLVSARVAESNLQRWNCPGPIAQMTAVWAIALIPAFVTLDAGLPLAVVRVCVATSQGAQPIDGYLVAQTSDAVFIADGLAPQDPNATRRLITIPSSRVLVVFSGGSSNHDPCPSQ